MIGEFAGAAVALAVGLLTLGYQVWQKRAEDRAREQDEIKRRKLAVVSDLVAYRFAITNGDKATSFDISKFNAALCSIPIEFIEDHDVIAIYRGLGTDFTGAKLVKIVNAMVKAADPSKARYDFAALVSIPSVGVKPLPVCLSGMTVEHVPHTVASDAEQVSTEPDAPLNQTV
ncbi:MAG: hypothetical protein DI498_13805 [Paracoccus denitrificans]|nr:MAG: hypothetical protein DI498_13805 [Paracoccus denitrificans]PZO82882.1 MAG: hypothetical protein DI633_13805 [Paracoccus denitrificans]